MKKQYPRWERGYRRHAYYLDPVTPVAGVQLGPPTSLVPRREDFLMYSCCLYPGGSNTSRDVPGRFKTLRAAKAAALKALVAADKQRNAELLSLRKQEEQLIRSTIPGIDRHELELIQTLLDLNRSLGHSAEGVYRYLKTLSRIEFTEERCTMIGSFIDALKTTKPGSIS